MKLHTRNESNKIYLVENLSVVDSDNSSDHFWKDDHVTKMSLNTGWLLQDTGGLLSLLKTVQETEMLSLQSSVKTSAHATREHLSELFSET